MRDTGGEFPDRSQFSDWINCCLLRCRVEFASDTSFIRENVLAVGDGEPDICMLAAAKVSVAFQPKTENVANAAEHFVTGNLLEILAHVPH